MNNNAKEIIIDSLAEYYKQKGHKNAEAFANLALDELSTQMYQEFLEKEKPKIKLYVNEMLEKAEKNIRLETEIKNIDKLKKLAIEGVILAALIGLAVNIVTFYISGSENHTLVNWVGGISILCIAGIIFLFTLDIRKQTLSIEKEKESINGVLDGYGS